MDAPEIAPSDAAPADAAPADAAPSDVGRPRTRLDPDVRREQILVEASALFADRDYSAVSLEMIANGAGVTRGLVHHYFGSKRGLFLAVVERAVVIPEGVALIPAGASGTFAEIVALCVRNWMRMIEATGGLWIAADSGGIGGADADAVLARARDDLVERMVAEVPFPDTLDPDLLRSALRCYAAVARVATEEWLVRGTLSREQTETLLRLELLGLVERTVPALGAQPT